MNVKSLSDGDSYNEEENISENGNEERYLFSSNLQWNGNNKKKSFLVPTWTVHNYVMLN